MQDLLHRFLFLVEFWVYEPRSLGFRSIPLSYLLGGSSFEDILFQTSLYLAIISELAISAGEGLPSLHTKEFRCMFRSLIYPMSSISWEFLGNFALFPDLYIRLNAWGIDGRKLHMITYLSLFYFPKLSLSLIIHLFSMCSSIDLIFAGAPLFFL
jgi:hypothetical protein